MENEVLSAALWLSNNTKLTPKQISDLFPEVHEFKILLIRSGMCDLGIEEINPIENGFVTQQQLNKMSEEEDLDSFQSKNVKRYIPKILRNYVPGVIVWLKQNYPHLTAKQISMSLGITPKRVTDIINANEAQPVSPISVQIFNEATLRELVKK